MKRTTQLRWPLAVCALILGLCAPLSAKTICVDDDATGANDGSSWMDAFDTLQDALAVAVAGDEIKVAQGIYRPDRGAGMVPGDHRATFRLISGVLLQGGYAGLRAPDPNARDVGHYETRLSGDLQGDDVELPDPCDLQEEPTRIDNSYHVVTAYTVDANAVLDGFTITGGHFFIRPRNGTPVGGAGMLTESGRPTVIGCTFAANAAPQGGVLNYAGGDAAFVDCTFSDNSMAGVCNISSSPTLTDCEFTGNHTSGLHNESASNPTVVGCLFRANGRSAVSNRAESRPTFVDCLFTDGTSPLGAAIYADGGCAPAIIGCVFRANRAELYGGALCLGEDSHATIHNCVFVGNSAAFGGGICGQRSTSSMDVVNCTFLGNRAEQGDGIWAYGRVALTNCIVRDDVDASPQALTTVAYCNIAGVWPGDGNIDVDPCFADPGEWDPNGTPDDPNDDLWLDGDYHLKSRAGRWDPATESWVVDPMTSLCVDAGAPDSPVGDEPVPHGHRVNMGAYGGTAEASKSDSGPVAGTSDYVFLPDQSDVALTLTFQGDLVHLLGQTIPPAGGADFFVLNLDALAQREYGDGDTPSNLTYASGDGDHVGPLRWMDDPDAEIKNLGLLDPNVDARVRHRVGVPAGDDAVYSLSGRFLSICR